MNEPVKITVNGTRGTMLFSQVRLRLKITRSKIALTVHYVQCYFPRKSQTRNHPVKITVKGTWGTMLFSQVRLRLKITQSKIALRVHRIHCYSSKKE